MFIFKREEKYTVKWSKKKFTEKELLKNIEPNGVAGILIHKGVKEIYNNLLNSEEKKLVEQYYRNSSNEIFNYLDYVPFIQIIGYKLPSYLSGVWTSLIPHDIYRSELVANEIILKYDVSGYELAEIHHGLANLAYRRCEKNTEILEFVAKHGLKAYELKDSYFKKKECVRLDFFWSTLCNVLKQLNMLDEAIEIAAFAAQNDAYDNTQGGWTARLEKLIKTKNKQK